MADNESNIAHDNAPILELRYLLENFRKCLKFWFLAGNVNIPASLEFVNACTDIMMHGIVHLELLQKSEEKDIALQKFMNELDWLRKSRLIRDLNFIKCAEDSTATSQKSAVTVKHFLQNWVLQNLQHKTMCASVEALIIMEKELLQANYHENAFLRIESYAHAFIIGLSAFELNQYSLLSQIDKSLYSNSITMANNDVTDGIKAKKHKRTSSHPNFSLPPVKPSVPLKETTENTSDIKKSIRIEVPENFKLKTVFPTFRKTKSMPIISITSTESANFTLQVTRPRSKTMNMIKRRSLPKPILVAHISHNERDISILKNLPSVTHNINAREDQPSTSVNSCNSQISSSTISSSTTTNTAGSSISPVSSSPSRSQRIEVINCDDIKIWTDQSLTPQTPQNIVKSQNLNTNILPSPMTIKKPKSISPINSFLSSLFGTPPTYSTWYTSDVQTEQATAAVLPIGVVESHNGSFCNTGSVFDSFMPVYGTKVQSKQKTNLFEDGISTLDYKPTVSNRCNGASQQTPEKAIADGTASNTHQRIPASCQSLTDFLEMSKCRNNTELEKENAHFRISEAIISAIEHMKWAKSQRNESPRKNEAVIATDWLENERKKIETNKKTETKNEQPEVVLADSSEFIPFVEHSEPCLESLSAEVVGLSLISRFNNDKHMPKVSELKWLVSDEDTPQQLLPMPDRSPTVNPDEHIFPPMTRGTKYWAPPRPQIIFTDHPIPNRKELIRKQNNRCAGCGMRVSSQNISSFRYCTYFGKYHCTGCHRNQMSATPAKILQLWDFKCYPVSVFAYRLLEQMYTFPLFHVPDLNPALYIKSKLLLDARNKRLKLKFIKDFVKACRFAMREQSYFDTIPDYITYDVDTWSMSDLVEARNESMQRSINELIEKCENHIFHCVLCTGRGFCCEYCLRDRVIYPWENKVFRCDRCGSCFHLSCWKAMVEVCCRCQRIWNRQNEVTESLSDK